MALILFVPLLIYRSHARPMAKANVIERVVREVTLPLQAGLSSAVGWFSDRWYEYVAVVGARRSLSETRIERDRLLRELASLRWQVRENEVLRALLGLQQHAPTSHFVAASVVGAGIGPESRTLTIDRGLSHGLEAGLPVLGAAGLVGVSRMCSWSTCEVALITDPRVSVQVEVLDTGARGRARGDREARLVVEDVPRPDGLAIEAQLVTSGLGGVMPRGVPVGVVKEVSTEMDRPVLQGLVVPNAALTRIRVVQVVLDPERATVRFTPEALQPTGLWGVSD